MNFDSFITHMIAKLHERILTTLRILDFLFNDAQTCETVLYVVSKIRKGMLPEY